MYLIWFPPRDSGRRVTIFCPFFGIQQRTVLTSQELPRWSWILLPERNSYHKMWPIFTFANISQEYQSFALVFTFILNFLFDFRLLKNKTWLVQNYCSKEQFPIIAKNSWIVFFQFLTKSFSVCPLVPTKDVIATFLVSGSRLPFAGRPARISSLKLEPLNSYCLKIKEDTLRFARCINFHIFSCSNVRKSF